MRWLSVALASRAMSVSVALHPGARTHNANPTMSSMLLRQHCSFQNVCDLGWLPASPWIRWGDVISTSGSTSPWDILSSVSSCACSRNRFSRYVSRVGGVVVEVMVLEARSRTTTLRRRQGSVRTSFRLDIECAAQPLHKIKGSKKSFQNFTAAHSAKKTVCSFIWKQPYATAVWPHASTRKNIAFEQERFSKDICIQYNSYVKLKLVIIPNYFPSKNYYSGNCVKLAFSFINFLSRRLVLVPPTSLSVSHRHR